MALELLGGELIDTDMVLESRGPSNGGGGLTLAERLARIEVAIDRVDGKMDHELLGLERRVEALEAHHPAQLAVEFRELQKQVRELDRSTWSAAQVQAALAGYRRWLWGMAIAVAGLGFTLLTDLYSVHAR